MIIPKKSLGQNFLIDKNIIEKIVNVTDVKNKNILEVGPGTGNLTEAILKKKPQNLIVIEKDNQLADDLSLKFFGQIKIINKDILDVNEYTLSDKKLTVFGNLPYNISTEILCKWILNLKNDFWFDCLILMFQKEVADRIIAKFNTKNYSRLSILSKWKLEIEKICDINPNCFFPKPKVESSLIICKPKKKFYRFKDPRNLEKITRVFFMHKRKMLKKPYKQMFNENSKVAEKLKIDLNLRPHNLNLNTYFMLTEEYENLRS